MTVLKKLLIRHEGLKLKPYTDSVGKLTIGIGRNLDDVGITEEEAHMLLENDILKTVLEVERVWPWVINLSYPRKCVVYSMAFNMGIQRLSSFKKFLAALKDERFEDASHEMLDSKWATQVGKRADELSQIMREDAILDLLWPAK